MGFTDAVLFAIIVFTAAMILKAHDGCETYPATTHRCSLYRFILDKRVTVHTNTPEYYA